MIQDGTYIVRNGQIKNYADHWNYGFVVAKKKGMVWDPTGSNQNPTDQADLFAVSGIYHAPLVGVWTDPETGYVHVEPVEHVDSAEKAKELAIQRNQSCVYDLFLGKVTKTEDL